MSCILDPISSQPCNAHLVVLLVDLVLVTVFPEMGVSESAMGIVVGDEHTLGLAVPPRPDSRPP